MKNTSIVKEALVNKALFIFLALNFFITPISFAFTWYQLLDVPSNASQELLEEALAKKLRTTSTDLHHYYIHAFQVLADPKERAAYDFQLQRLEDSSAPRNYEELRASMIKEYLASGINAASLVHMATSEMRKEHESIESRNHRISQQPGRSLNLWPPSESSQYKVMRFVLLEYLSLFLDSKPNFEQVLTYRNALRAKLAPLTHFNGIEFKPIRLTLEDSRATKPARLRLLEYLRDHVSLSKDQFYFAFERWVILHSAYEPHEVVEASAQESFAKWIECGTQYDQNRLEIATCLTSRLDVYRDDRVPIVFNSLSPQESLSILESLMLRHYQENLVSENRSPHKQMQTNLIRVYSFLVYSVIERDESLKKKVKKWGNLWGRLRSFFGWKYQCQYTLGLTARKPSRPVNPF